MAMKRLDPVAMCCKSATAKNKALLAGMDEETARKKVLLTLPSKAHSVWPAEGSIGGVGWLILCGLC